MVSALLIARTLLALGHAEAARRYLEEGLEGLDTAEQPQALALLALLATGPEATNGWAGPRQDGRGDAPLPGSEASVIQYTPAKYQAYDHPSRVDHIKKLLELAAVQRCLADFAPASGRPRMLDIGCATGRYLRWFAEQGYHATGYDIEAAAIHIAHHALVGHPHIAVYQRDILHQAPEPDQYAVITSMMGTFNHIAPAQRQVFLSWVCRSLQPGGRFIFSSWNPACRWQTYLQLYTPGEQALLRSNSLPLARLHPLLTDAGLRVQGLHPIGFVPGDHVPAWLDEADDEVILWLDGYLAGELPADQAQLFVLCTEKPGDRPLPHG